MAWRDSRASRRKLLLFSSSIVIGIAALVALGSFAANLRTAVDQSAKGLLGADLVVTARDPFTGEMDELFAEMGGHQTREVVFSSMVYFPKTEGTRLVQVRALGRGFPYYGEIETTPPEGAKEFHEGGALVDEALMLQFGVESGDEVKVGQLTLPISGALEQVPGENMVFATIAPRVYIPLELLEATGLVGEQSLARFNVYFQYGEETDVDGLVGDLRQDFRRLGLRADTVEERKREIGRNLDNLNHFLNVAGFIALLLGAVGVASAIHVHVKQKHAGIAVLRCLGCSVSQSFAIYLIQAMALGLVGALVGAGVGIVVQDVIPKVFSEFLPFELELYVSWRAVARGMFVGFTVCLVFALLPLIALRRISPLAVLRSTIEGASIKHDWAGGLLAGLIVLGLLLFARAQTDRWSYAFSFTGGLVVSFLLLGLVAWFLRGVARTLISGRWPYVWRQGVANLYRPQNRTMLLLVSLGLGTFLVLTLYLVNQTLSADLFPADRENQANAALFDIQTDQKAKVREIVESHGLPILQDVPIVTMRISQLEGQTVQEILRDRGRDIPRWALRREYRSTYRDTLVDSEDTVAGVWPPRERSLDLVPVSVEEEIAADLNLEIGDQFVFDVQGIPITNQVVHLRKVDWKRVQPNFFVVFPSGVLEEAPSFHILTTRVASREKSAQMQRAVVKAFPNVSIIDLALVLDTIDAILSKIGFVIRFMALFTVGTGIIVLIASVLTGKFQRLQESILLRTLGASGGQVQQILCVEYFLLGILAAGTGVVLATGSAWALAEFIFQIEYKPRITPLVVALILVPALTLVTGAVSNLNVLRRPPLEVLRQSA